MGFFKGLLRLFLRLIWLLLVGVGGVLILPGMLCLVFSPCVIVIKILWGTSLLELFQEIQENASILAVFLILFVVGIVLGVLAEFLSDYIKKLTPEKKESRSTSKRTNYSGTGYSSSTGYLSGTSYFSSIGCSSGSFDAGSYVRSHCSDHIYGVTSSADINRIKNDSNLTSQQRQQALTEYQRQSDLYY